MSNPKLHLHAIYLRTKFVQIGRYLLKFLSGNDFSTGDLELDPSKPIYNPKLHLYASYWNQPILTQVIQQKPKFTTAHPPACMHAQRHFLKTWLKTISEDNYPDI